MESALLFKLVFLALILAVVAFEVAGDILFKKWAMENQNSFLIIGLVVYFIGTIFWALSLKYEGLAKAISVVTVLNLVIVALVGIIVFKEDLSLINKIGIGLGVASVILVEI